MGSGTTTHGIPYPNEADSFDPSADIQQSVTYVDTHYEPAFATYKLVVPWVGNATSAGATAGTYGLSPTGVTGGLSSVFYFDPADWTADTRATKLRVRAFIAPNQVAPGGTWTFGLYPVTVTYSASGSSNTYALGAVTSGSTVAFATPGASSQSQNNSGDFTAPAAGYYALGVNLSGNAAAGNQTDVRAALQMRQV